MAQSLYLRWTLDDAYIAFAYAQNWVLGNGLVFNVGERVEGYTSFSWVALSALGLRLKADVVPWSMGLGILAAVGTVLVTWRLAGELMPREKRNGAVLGALLVASYPAVGWWAPSGMETVLFALLATLVLWRHVRDGAGSTFTPIWLALASMTRPEGCLLAAVVCADVFRTARWPVAVRYAARFLAIFLPYCAWRLWYYGHPFPNTFYAKVGYTPDQVLRGLVYLKDFVTSGNGAILVGGALMAPVTGIGRRAAAVYVFIVAYFGYIVLVGGDYFLFHRFFVAVVPTLAALTIAGIGRGVARLTSSNRIAGATFLLVLLLWAAAGLSLWRAERFFLPQMRFGAGLTRGIATFAREHTRKDESIATIFVGAVKFYSGRTVIDMVGMTDEHIAHRSAPGFGRGLAGHERYDSQYVLGRRPRYIVIGGVNPDLGAASDMWTQPLFRRCYVREQGTSAAGMGFFRRIDGCTDAR
ncbi:MAG: hypothetical protein PHU25_10355 [Deltaproteobacteria bacterium]|nr:hypothetical protein [Deltaproteobacteria bacterium]